MIPYEDLVAGLASWRARNGMAPIHTVDYLGEPTEHRINTGAPEPTDVAAVVRSAPHVQRAAAATPAAAPAPAAYTDGSDILEMDDSGMELDAGAAGYAAEYQRGSTTAESYEGPGAHQHDDPAQYGQEATVHASQAQSYAYGESGPYRQQQYGTPDPYAQQPQQYANPADPYGQQQYGDAAAYPADPLQYGESGPYRQQQYGTPDPYGQQPQQYANPADPYGQQPQQYANPADPYGQQSQQYGSYGNAYDSDQSWASPGQGTAGQHGTYEGADQQDLLYEVHDAGGLEVESEATMIGSSPPPPPGAPGYGGPATAAYQAYSLPDIDNGVPSEPVYDSLAAAREYAEELDAGFGYDQPGSQPPPLEPFPGEDDDDDFVIPFDEGNET